MTLANPRIGELVYGWVGGYDTWAFSEVGEGGVVVVPFAIDDHGTLQIVLLRQHRHNEGGDAWNVPRGFVDPDESHVDGALRELAEETGWERSATELIDLEGAPGNPNNAFFVTREGGIRFFAIEIESAALERFAPRCDPTERIREVALRSWSEVARLSDLLSVAAVARLLAHLCTSGRFALHR
jgi:8-oxo-dGTP pyrophosphatase MutT (NUDIX family)